MSHMRCLSFRLLLNVFVLYGSMCAQEKVTVRFVDFQSGKPIANISALVTLWNGASIEAAMKHKGVVSKTNAKTAKDGTLAINVPAPAPEHLTIASLETVNPVDAELMISSVLNAGAIVPYRKGGSGLKPSVKAGGGGNPHTQAHRSG
jgi:hypothetical protein